MLVLLFVSVWTVCSVCYVNPFTKAGLENPQAVEKNSTKYCIVQKSDRGNFN